MDPKTTLNDLLTINLGAFQGLSSGLHNALAGANLPTGANLPATAGWPYGALQVRYTPMLSLRNIMP